MTRQRQPEQQAPPVQRLRVRYAKRGRARFTSHRDFGRAFERALRRSGVPMAYSSGFSPHPRISYANASPTSAATEAEYLEIGLCRRCDPERVRAALDNALPPGLDVLEVDEANSTSLIELLQASAWSVELGEPDLDELRSAVDQLLACQHFQVQRMTKSGLRDFDVRSAIIALEVVSTGVLNMITRQETPLVRPDDVVKALMALQPSLESDRPALMTRLAQGALPSDNADDRPLLIDPFSGVQIAVW